MQQDLPGSEKAENLLKEAWQKLTQMQKKRLRI